MIINKHQNPEIHNVVTAKVDVYQSGDILKRLSGMPGHTVSPNGREKRLLQQNEYWLASDANRYTGTEGTTDSNDFGPVAREDITGVVVWKTRFAQGLPGRPGRNRAVQAGPSEAQGVTGGPDQVKPSPGQRKKNQRQDTTAGPDQRQLVLPVLLPHQRMSPKF